MIRLTTTLGDILIELDYEKAPLSAQNFETYVRDGFYDGTLFHRVIPNFMIQGGGLLPGLTPKPTREPIRNEASNGVSNQAGTVAMARTSDPHSATAQFFINVVDNGFLDFSAETREGWGYTVFGKVVGGMDVVQRIKDVPTTFKGMHQDVPAQDILIIKAIVE